MSEETAASKTTAQRDIATLMWEAIQQFRLENPGINRYEAKFADGSKVVITVPRQLS